MESDTLKVNPYEYMGLQQTCDKSTLKNAYRRKVLEIHPDKNPGHEIEFIQLNACYRYIKKRIEQKERYHTNLNNQQPLNSVQMEKMASKKRTVPQATDVPSRTKIDFQKPLVDTSIIGDTFDVNEAYREMKRYRPKTTRYVDILNAVDTPEYVTNKYNKDLFDAAFEKNKQRICSKDLIAYEQLAAWNDSTDLPCASIVEDGETMFVTNDTNTETLSAIKGYMMITDKISEFTDENTSFSRDHQVSDTDLRNYAQSRSNIYVAPKKSARDFKESMKDFDYQMLDNQHDAQRQNANRIRKVTTQLSPDMQAKLKASLRIQY